MHVQRARYMCGICVFSVFSKMRESVAGGKRKRGLGIGDRGQRMEWHLYVMCIVHVKQAKTHTVLSCNKLIRQLR